MEKQDKTGQLYVCDNCGIEFELTKTQKYAKARKHYCCRHCHYSSRVKDLKGEVFGRLTVIDYVGKNKRGDSLYSCSCDCGKIYPVQGSALVNGSIRSCGCLTRDSTRSRATTHGMSGTRLYGIWKGMRQRCNCINRADYQDYGKVGILKLHSIYRQILTNNDNYYRI